MSDHRPRPTLHVNCHGQEEQIGVASESAEHDQAAVSDAGEDTPYDDQEDEVPSVTDILGEDMARPDAVGGDIEDMAQGTQGAAAQDSGQSDDLSGIAQVNVLEYTIVFSGVRVILLPLSATCV